MKAGGRRAAGARGDIKLYRRLLGYAWPYKWAFALSILGMVILSATTAGFAALMKPLVDEGLVQRNATMIKIIPPLIIAIFAARIIGNFLAEYAINWVGRRVTFDLRQAMFVHLVRLPSSFYDTNPTGGLISKLVYDVGQIARSVTEAVLTIFRDGLTVVGLLVWMLILDWRLTLLFAILTPVTTLLLRAMSRRFRKTSSQIQGSVSDILTQAQEVTESQRVVKAFGGERHVVDLFFHANERNRRQSMRRVATSAIGVGLLQLVAATGLALVIYMALAMGDITAGGFVSYITATTWMMGPAKRMSKVNEIVQTGLAAADSAFGLLDEAGEADTGRVELEHVKGRVEYRHVGFRYASATREALDDVSFTIEPGQTVALVGTSGSGKTTVASLLPRFYRVDSGEIRLDGVDINDLSLANLRSHIALVGQETLLFDDTIRSNIAYGRAEIDEARLQEAARAAHVLEFAKNLPEGLDTRVGEKGLRLSGGQRQRIAIARALYKNAPILILDEATSALDTESERYVQAAMQQLLKNRTTLVIAHRLSTVEHAHRIVVLAQGRVAESGTHDELLARDGFYAGLYRKQFAET